MLWRDTFAEYIFLVYCIMFTNWHARAKQGGENPQQVAA